MTNGRPPAINGSTALGGRHINPGLRIFHNLSAMLCFAYVVWVIQRYIRQREELAKTVQQQRDDLLQDVELAAQVQRMFPRRPLQHLYRHRHRQ